MGKQKDPMMADARYVAVMLANGVKYAQYDALDEMMTEHSNQVAKIIITAMGHYPEADVHDWDSLVSVVEQDGARLDYETPAESEKRSVTAPSCAMSMK